MWLFTPFGFFSAIRHKGAKKICVRARCRIDLENLMERYKGFDPIKETKNTDYAFRTWVEPKRWGNVLKDIGENINYPNFKSEVQKTQGWDREQLYHKVWAALLPLQRGTKSSGVDDDNDWEGGFGWERGIPDSHPFEPKERKQP